MTPSAFNDVLSSSSGRHSRLSSRMSEPSPASRSSRCMLPTPSFPSVSAFYHNPQFECFPTKASSSSFATYSLCLPLSVAYIPANTSRSMNPLSLPKRPVSQIDTCASMLLQELPTQCPTNAVVLNVGDSDVVLFRNGSTKRRKEKRRSHSSRRISASLLDLTARDWTLSLER